MDNQGHFIHPFKLCSEYSLKKTGIKLLTNTHAQLDNISLYFIRSKKQKIKNKNSTRQYQFVDIFPNLKIGVSVNINVSQTRYNKFIYLVLYDVFLKSGPPCLLFHMVNWTLGSVLTRGQWYIARSYLHTRNPLFIPSQKQNIYLFAVSHWHAPSNCPLDMSLFSQL